MVNDETWRSASYRDIAQRQAWAGVTGALSTFAAIRRDEDKASALNSISGEQGRAGQLNEAYASLVKAREYVGNSNPLSKSGEYYSVAIGQECVGDSAGARQTAALISERAPLEQFHRYRDTYARGCLRPTQALATIEKWIAVGKLGTKPFTDLPGYLDSLAKENAKSMLSDLAGTTVQIEVELAKAKRLETAD